MGNAKAMNTIGEYNFYTKDNFEFVKIISSIFKVNLQANFFNMSSYFADNHKSEEFFDFKFKETYNITINSLD